MGLPQLVQGKKSSFDHALHFVVAAFIVIIHIFQITDNSHGGLARGLAALIVAGMSIQATYHLGTGLKYLYTDKQEESNVGVVARNLLTSLSLSVAAVRAGVLDGKGNTDAGQLTLAWISFGLLCLMKLLDGVLDGEADDWFVSTKCPDADEFEDPMIVARDCCNQKAGFNGRMIITHLLLIPSALILLINHNGMDDAAISIAVISIAAHAFLYPFMFILNYVGVVISYIGSFCNLSDGNGSGNAVIIWLINKITGSEYDPCEDSLESFNRIPLVRTIVTLLAIPTLSYVVGESAHANANVASWDLTLALALYLGADAIGRNVV